MELKEIREELDKIDRDLLQLFQKRMALSEEVAKDKLKTGKAIFDGKREAEKLDSVAEMLTDPELKAPAQAIFRGLMTLSRRKQLEFFSSQKKEEDFFFREEENLSLIGKRLAFQGVKGAYSYLAGRLFFAEENMLSVDHFQDVIAELQSGKADYGILPIDNSTYGMVQDNYDLLAVHEDIFVIKEIFYPVSHCLCTTEGHCREDILKVYSHPQALSQCRDFFQNHPKMETIPDLNTAMAAKRVSETKEKGAAVLCSKEAAEYYGLRILEEGLSAEANTTRFFLLTKEKIFPKDADKVSIILEIPDKVGSLYHVLENFMWNDLSLSMIQSRPLGDGAFSYRFFIDILGRLSDSGMKNALCALQEEGISYRILGNYTCYKVKNS